MCREGAIEADSREPSELFAVAALAHGLQPLKSDGGAGKARAKGEHDLQALDQASTGASSSNAGSLEIDWDPDQTDAVALAQRYQPLQAVGRGAYGTVFLAMDRDTNERVALKRLTLGEGHSNGVPADVIREVALLRDFVHPNIVQLRDFQIVSMVEFQLVFEYVPDDLHMILKDHRLAGTQLPLASVRRHFAGLLNGIHACHSLSIIHRDLKPQNILVHPVDGLKICDFGLARTFSRTVHKYTPEVVTLWYRGPELLLGHPQYGPALDIWSAGCILAEMATGRPTFPGDSEIGTVFKIMQLLGSPTEATWPGFEQCLADWSPHFPKWPPTDLGSICERRPEFGEAGMDLIRALLVMNPASRLTAKRAMAHAFLSQAKSAQHRGTRPRQARVNLGWLCAAGVCA
jgi:serine/threonine protein kinase